MARMGFAIDNRACIGCHACTVACKSEHLVPLGVNRTWVKYIEKGTFPHTRRSFSVQRCNHCADAPCVEICPVTSLFKRPDGIVDFDSDRCIGCKACMQACPYDALYLDPESNTAAKCNYCTHRVDNGYEPACVVVCPVEAIVSGDLDDPDSRIARLDRGQRVQYPKIEKGTQPKLFYVGGETAALDPAAAPPQRDYLWSANAGQLRPEALASARSESEQGARARRVYDPTTKPTPWRWMVSAYVTTKAIATGAAMISFILYLFGDVASVLPLAPAAVALLFLAVTGALLVSDLKRPERFLYVLLRPQFKSWLTRGAYFITFFALLLLGALALSLTNASRSAQTLVGGLTSLAAACTAAYTGLLFAQAKGRDYWQSPLLTVTMLVDALVAGTVVVTLLGAFGWEGGLACGAARFGLTACALLLGGLLVVEFVPAHATRNAADTARSITRGEFAPIFWIWVVGVGILAPIVLTLMSGSPAVVAPAALALLAGIAAKNHVIVQAPQRIPLS